MNRRARLSVMGTTDNNTPTGAYPITLMGNGGGIRQNTTVTLTVGTQQPPPNGMIGYGINGVSIPKGTQPSFDACCVLIYEIYPYVFGTAHRNGRCHCRWCWAGPTCKKPRYRRISPIPRQNGAMFGNAGFPSTPANPPSSNTQTELGSTT